MAKSKTVGVASRRKLPLTELAAPHVTLGNDAPDPDITPVAVPAGALKAANIAERVMVAVPLTIAGPWEPRQVTHAFLLDGGKVVARCELAVPVLIGSGHALELPPNGVIF